MGLFDDLFGGKNTTTTKQNTATNSATTGQQSQTNETTTGQQTNQSQTQNTSGTTSSGTTQAQTSVGSNVTSSLDQGTIDILKGLLNPSAGNASSAIGNTENADALKDVAAKLYQKATGGNSADVAASVAASSEKARLDYETGGARDAVLTAQGIGSTKNTYSQLIKQKGLNDLNTQIAAISATGALQADQLNSADFNSVADAIVKASSVAGNDAQSALSPVLAIINALKGAQSTSSSTDTSTGTSATNTVTDEQNIANVLSQVTGKSQGSSDTNQSGTLSSVSNTTGTDQTKTSKGIIGDILSIF